MAIILEHADGREFTKEEEKELMDRIDKLEAKEGPHGVTDEAKKKIQDEIAARGPK